MTTRLVLLPLILCFAACAGGKDGATATDAALIEPAAPETIVAAPDVLQADEIAATPGSDPLSYDKVDFSCRADADCAVKNVGNCCGYYPACVNKDSPTFPEEVMEHCQREGLMSICGFQEIDACVCVAGRCEAAPSGISNLQSQ